MKKISFLFPILITIILACEDNEPIKNDNEILNYDGLVLKAGFICGWCAGGDSVTITENVTYYEYTNYCYNGGYDSTRATDEETWQELNNLLDLDKLLAIDINKCYMCADGCDTWIAIEYDTISHYIRFGYQDSAIVAPVQPLIDKLNEIRISMQMQFLEDL